MPLRLVGDDAPHATVLLRARQGVVGGDKSTHRERRSSRLTIWGLATPPPTNLYS
jgi:hypothetical protein